MKIWIYYNTTDEPWGGINSFLRSLKSYYANFKEIKLVDSIDSNPDIILISAASTGQNQEASVEEILEFKKDKRSLIKKLFNRSYSRPLIIHRLDGLRASYNKEFIPSDEKQLKLSQIADFIIFQSKASLEIFQSFGYKSDNYKIIHNGVDQSVFNLEDKTFFSGDRKLKILSSSWSTSIHKGFETIAKYSEHPNVESYFVGRWNQDIDSRNVTIIEPTTGRDLAQIYKDCDVFLHAAENDACPNVVLEALSCGLPVIYNTTGGTPELSANYGVPITDNVQYDLDQIRLQYPILVDKIRKDIEIFSIERAGRDYLTAFKEFYGISSNNNL